MKKLLILFLAICFVFTGCSAEKTQDLASESSTVDMMTTAELITDEDIDETTAVTTEQETTILETTTKEEKITSDISIYSDVLNRYKELYADMENVDWQDEEKYDGYNVYALSMLEPGTHKLMYALIDMADDGVPELFIAHNDTWSENSDYNIIDIWGCVDGKTQRIFDTYSMGYRVLYTLCEGNVIENYNHGGAYTWDYVYYKIGSNSVQPTEIESIYYVGEYVSDSETIPTYTHNKADGTVEVHSSEQRYNEVVNSYKKSENIDWVIF